MNIRCRRKLLLVMKDKVVDGLLLEILDILWLS